MPLVGLAFLLLVLFVVVVPFTPVAGKIKRSFKEIFGRNEAPVRVVDDVPVVPVPAPDLSPLVLDPDPVMPTGPVFLNVPSSVDVTKLSKGIDLKVAFDTFAVLSGFDLLQRRRNFFQLITSVVTQCIYNLGVLELLRHFLGIRLKSAPQIGRDSLKFRV